MSDVPTTLQCTLCPAKIPVGAMYCPVCGTPAPHQARAAGQPGGTDDLTGSRAGGPAGPSGAAFESAGRPPGQDGGFSREREGSGGPKRPHPEAHATFAQVRPPAPLTTARWIDAIRSGVAKVALFEGRTGRHEFWTFNLSVAALAFVLQLSVSSGSQEGQSGSLLVSVLAGLVTVSSSVRRLHDIGRSGYWCLLSLTGIGVFVVLYWLVQPGDPGSNRFGQPSPS